VAPGAGEVCRGAEAATGLAEDPLQNDKNGILLQHVHHRGDIQDAENSPAKRMAGGEVEVNRADLLLQQA